eukprot:1916536-Pyramimonas_sp.AAC.1
MRGEGIHYRTDQSDQVRGFIPTGRTNQMRGEGVYLQREHVSGVKAERMIVGSQVAPLGPGLGEGFGASLEPRVGTRDVPVGPVKGGVTKG